LASNFSSPWGNWGKPVFRLEKALMDSLVAKFLEHYDAAAKDAIWQQHFG